MEGTNGIPRALEQALLKAKDWSDRYEELERTIRQSSGVGAAQRNQEDRDEMDRQGAGLLEDVVRAVEETWGWAR